MPGRSRSRWAWTLAIGVPAAVLAWSATSFLPFLADDALISLRYARRLLEGRGLTWTDGERVEGYSNLLWILLDAGLGALGVDLVRGARILGLGSLVVATACIAALVAKGERGRPLAALGGGLLLAVSGPAGAWAVGGLEEPLVAALFALALVTGSRLLEAGRDPPGSPRGVSRELRAGIPLALLCLSRPDGPLFALVFALVMWASPGERRFARALALGALPALAVLLQLGFRLVYYGDWLPNTAYLKARVDALTLRQGAGYLRAAWPFLWPALVTGAAGALLGWSSPARRGAVKLLVASFSAWTLYVLAIGGDIFPAHRHLLVPLVACAFLAALAFERALVIEQRLPRLAATLALGALLAAFAFLQRRDPEVRVAEVQRWQWDGEVVGRLFGGGFRAEQPLWAVSAAGCLPYFSGLPALDILGLTDRHIARTEPDRSLPLYHDRGDGAYVLARAPDLITFGVPSGGPPVYVTGKELRDDPRFREQYERVLFEGFEPYRVPTRTFVRREGRVGIERRGEFVRHPAHLLTGATAQPGPDGGIVARLPAGMEVSTQPLELASGRWRVRLVPENPLVAVEAEVTAGAGLRVGPGGSCELPQDSTLVLHLQARWLETLVAAVELERVGAAVTSGAGDSPGLTARALLAPALEQSTIRGSEGSVLLEPDSPAADWTSSGAGFSLADSRWLTSRHPDTGEEARGTLRSSEFAVPERAWLELAVGGIEARDFHTRAGVRLGRGERTLQLFTARQDGGPREVRFDLAPLAGERLWLEVFDDSRIGHVFVGRIALHQRFE